MATWRFVPGASQRVHRAVCVLRRRLQVTDVADAMILSRCAAQARQEDFLSCSSAAKTRLGASLLPALQRRPALPCTHAYTRTMTPVEQHTLCAPSPLLRASRRLFGRIVSRGTLVLFTSNRPPQDLYKGGLAFKYFEPFIHLITR